MNVLGPFQCVPHQRAPNRDQVVHRVTAVFGHAKCAKLWEVEVHFCGCFGLWRELKNHLDAIDGHGFARFCDVVRGRN